MRFCPLRSTRRRLALVSLGLLLLVKGAAAALETVVLTDGRGQYPLGLRLEILEDRERRLSIDDVVSPELAPRFVRSQMDVPNLGMARGDYWVRFRLRNAAATNRDWLLEVEWAVVDRVELYTPEPQGGFRVRAAGELVPFSSWELDHRLPTFSLSLAPGAEATYYVRFQGEDTMLLPLVVWSPQAFEAQRRREGYWFGLYYGVVLAMVLYNLQLFVLLRDPTYLHYAFAMSAFAGYQSCLDGLLNQYLWPSSPWWASRSLHFFAGLNLYLIALFTRSFLATAQTLPAFDRWFRVAPWFFIALTGWSFFGPVAAIAAAGSVVGMIAAAGILGAAVVRWRQGYTPARYFLVALFLLTLMAGAQSLRGFGFLPSNLFTDHGLQISVVVLSLTLSLALASRVSFLADSLEALNQNLEQRVRERTTEFEAASRHKSEFVANMSHELRTPLNAVIGFSEVLIDGMFGSLNAKQSEYLHDIADSGQHLLSLINDILDLTKVEAGRVEMEPSTFDLPAAIDNALVLTRERAARREIRIEVDLDPRLGEVIADERKVKQVFVNLLSNAIKFTPERGRINITGRVEDRAVTISVSDTGIGIAPQDREVIFEAFRQAKHTAARPEGTGLGLTLARRFVELHGGRIWVESEVDHGSTFTFTLPMANPPQVEVQST